MPKRLQKTTKFTPAAKRAKATLPYWNATLADQLEAFLLTRYETRKPPVVAARLLAFILELNRRGLAFPTRDAAAEHLCCSKFSVDAALSVALERGLLTIHMETTSSDDITARVGVIRHRYYLPTEVLLLGAGFTHTHAPTRQIEALLPGYPNHPRHHPDHSDRPDMDHAA